MQPEQYIKADIKRYLTSRGIYWDIIVQGRFAKPGQPDIIACIDGKFVGIEVKTPTGEASAIQKMRGHEIEQSGGIYWIVHSTDELRWKLNELRCGR